MAELGQQVLGAEVVADAVGGVATQVDDRGRECERVRPACHVAIGPGDSGAAAQVGRIRTTEVYQVQRALPYPEGDGYFPRAVGLSPQLHAHRGKDTEAQQILPGPLE